MESLFKKAEYQRQDIEKREDFGHLLTSSVGWGFCPKGAATAKKESEAPLSEKSLVLDAFEGFGKEKIELNQGEPVRFKGGEIRLKNNLSHIHELLAAGLTSDLFSSIKEFLGEDIFSARFEEKQSFFKDPRVQVLFVTEEMQKMNGDTLQDLKKEQKELRSFFSSQASELFEKMIKAMKLEFEDYVVSAINFIDEEEKSHSYMELLVQEILYFKPKLIISLGARPSNCLLGKNERLTNIHGKLFSLRAKAQAEYEVKLMPLFHPELLTVATEMKKSAWTDMQEAMKFLTGE